MNKNVLAARGPCKPGHVQDRGVLGDVGEKELVE
jgi:hypothetical protein